MTGTFSCHRFSCHLKTNHDDILSFLCAFAALRLCVGTLNPSWLLVNPPTDVSALDSPNLCLGTCRRAIGDGRIPLSRGTDLCQGNVSPKRERRGAMAVRSLLVMAGIVALVFAGPIACSKNERRNDDRGNGASFAIKPDKKLAVTPFVQRNDGQGNGSSAAIKPDKNLAVAPFAQLNDDQKSRMLAVVQGNNEFAANLYGRLKDKIAGNLFFSPYSISAALAMTYAGAAGETQKQMAEVLHFTVPEQELHEAMARLRSSLLADNTKGYEIRVANRLWGQQGYKFLPEFLQTTRNYYGAELEIVDFVRNTNRLARRSTNGSRGKRRRRSKISWLPACSISKPVWC